MNTHVQFRVYDHLLAGPIMEEIPIHNNNSVSDLGLSRPDISQAQGVCGVAAGAAKRRSGSKPSARQGPRIKNVLGANGAGAKGDVSDSTNEEDDADASGDANHSGEENANGSGKSGIGKSGSGKGNGKDASGSAAKSTLRGANGVGNSNAKADGNAANSNVKGGSGKSNMKGVSGTAAKGGSSGGARKRQSGSSDSVPLVISP